MGRSLLVWCVGVAVLGLARAAGAEGEGDAVREVLARVAASLGMEVTDAGTRLGKGLSSCSAIDVDVGVDEAGAVELVAWPRVRGERIDVRKAADAEAWKRALEACASSIAPLSWDTDAQSSLCTRASFAWDDAQGPAELERCLRAVPGIDGAVATLLPLLGAPAPLPPEKLAERLREAAAADLPRRAAILAEIAPSLPALAPSATPGQSAFARLVLNTHGAAFDAFRFRVPEDGGPRRLVWAFAYPPGTAKGWYIAPVGGDAPEFKRFHQAPKLADTGVPEGHAILLQRSETPLRPGAEYVLWFQFKVETPVEMWFALGCFPFASTDRNTPDALMEALGLKAAG